MNPGHAQAGDVGHVGEEQCAHFISNGAELSKINRSRIGAVAAEDHLGANLLRLGAHGIEVDAMHNHMLNDQPHLYFMHFWANDDATKLAQGLRVALDETNSQKPQVK